MAKIVLQDPQKAVRLVKDAGGRIIGRTRLQKIAYLLEVTKLGEGFSFEYRHYGPYSEQLAEAVSTAKLFHFLKEEERLANWGGTYSIFTTPAQAPQMANDPRTELIRTAGDANPIALELAATAVFLALTGYQNPWEETARRKPEKTGQLDEAQRLYAVLKDIQTPAQLPNLENRFQSGQRSQTSS